MGESLRVQRFNILKTYNNTRYFEIINKRYHMYVAAIDSAMNFCWRWL